MNKEEIELTTAHEFTAHLVQQPKTRHIIYCVVGGEKWFEFNGWRLPSRLNKLWRVLAKRR